MENGTAQEREILCAQIELGLSLGESRFGIHTPRMNKGKITRQLLSLLAAYKPLPPMAVIDHCSPEIIGEVLSRGYHAGISLSPSKSSENQLSRMLEQFPRAVDRIMCNTDSSREFFEDLVMAFQSGNFSGETAANIFRNTAARFFRIP